MLSRVVPTIPPDPDIPGAGGLFGEEGLAAVGGFLGRRGWSLVEARPVQALYRPGRACLVRYRASALNRDGGPRVVTLCAETRPEHRPPLPADPGLARRYGLGEPVELEPPYLVWAFPYDPSLRHLPEAAWGESIKDRLASVDERVLALDVRPLRYRPRKRAVFKYVGLRGPDRRRSITFGKVMRGSKSRRVRAVADGINSRRPRWARFLWREPDSVRLSLPLSAESGPLLFAPLEGRSLRDLLLEGERLPAPERVARVLSELPGAIDPSGITRAPRELSAIAHSAGRTAAALVPDAAPAIRRIVDAIEDDDERLEQTIVHGDLYEAQVFVDERFGLGLIDLDDLGPGDPAMDAANFCAHLLALALAVPAAEGRLVAYRELARHAFLKRLALSPASFARREALAMLLLATGPFRVMSQSWPAEVAYRIRLAAQLID